MLGRAGRCEQSIGSLTCVHIIAYNVDTYTCTSGTSSYVRTARYQVIKLMPDVVIYTRSVTPGTWYLVSSSAAGVRLLVAHNEYSHFYCCTRYRVPCISYTRFVSDVWVNHESPHPPAASRTLRISYVYSYTYTYV